MGLFEVDEFWLGPVAAQLAPRAVLLGNLFRDQLDRYGELEIIADRWAGIAAALPAATGLVLNADDPLVADLGRKREALYYGVDDDALALPEMQHASDSKHCRRCGHAYAYEAAYLAHLGHYALPELRAAAARPAGRRHRRRAARHPLGGLHAAHGGRRAPDRAPAARPLQRLQRARRGGALPAPRHRARRRRRRPREPSSPRSGAPRRSTSAARPRSCWSRTPPAPTRSCARWRSRARELDLFGILNDRIADGRDVSLGLGRRLGAASRRTCAA